MKHSFILVLSLLISLSAAAQEQNTQNDNATSVDKTQAEQAEPKKEKKIKSSSKGPKAKVPFRFMANLHGGIGLMNYFGDVVDRDNTTVHRVGNRAGFNFGVGGNVTNYLELNIDGLIGKLNGNENAYGDNRNFESEVFALGLSLTYNFKNFIRDHRTITPFISVGVSYSDYNIYSDLQDADGNVYHWWDDGLIRNVDQSSPATDDIRIIERDFNYETRLNEFPEVAVAIPVGAGLDFNASRKFAVRLGAYYHFTTTDLIDNAPGGDKGFFSNDGFLFTSMSVYYRFDPFKKKAPKVEASEDEYGDLFGMVNEDADEDGISDMYDLCAGTPKGIPVDENGCPADDDGDGIPNFRDKELNTPRGKMVGPDGVAVDYKKVSEDYDGGKSLPRENLDKDWLYSQAADSKYTVHVGTYTNYDIPTQLKMRLAKMEGLVEQKVNDSVSVFTLGLFENFEEAEQKQNELRQSGIDQAFGVNEGVVNKVAVDVDKIYKEPEGSDPQADLDLPEGPQLVYGVELREYRLRIQLDKLSKLIAKHGVEMKVTSGGLKIYTIGAFDNYAEAIALKQEAVDLGVKNPTVTAKFNGEAIDIEAAREKEAELKESENNE